MNKVVFTGMFLCILCCAFTLSAQDCNKADNTLSIIACHEERYEKADKELNQVYGKAMKSIPPAAQQKLKEAQKAWLQYRDTGLDLAIELNKDLRSYGNIVVADYKATVAEKRVLELKYLMQGPEAPPIKW
ncbi:MAG: lysozyme inhibitor LprI family protein [Deltaproteobacteria bacterium]